MRITLLLDILYNNRSETVKTDKELNEKDLKKVVYEFLSKTIFKLIRDEEILNVIKYTFEHIEDFNKFINTVINNDIVTLEYNKEEILISLKIIRINKSPPKIKITHKTMKRKPKEQAEQIRSKLEKIKNKIDFRDEISVENLEIKKSIINKLKFKDIWIVRNNDNVLKLYNNYKNYYEKEKWDEIFRVFGNGIRINDFDLDRLNYEIQKVTFNEEMLLINYNYLTTLTEDQLKCIKGYTMRGDFHLNNVIMRKPVLDEIYYKSIIFIINGAHILSDIDLEITNEELELYNSINEIIKRNNIKIEEGMTGQNIFENIEINRLLEGNWEMYKRLIDKFGIFMYTNFKKIFVNLPKTQNAITLYKGAVTYDFLKNISENKIISSLKYTSVSYDIDTALRFANFTDILMIITIPKGFKILFVPDELSYYDEGEGIININTAFIVTKIINNQIIYTKKKRIKLKYVIYLTCIGTKKRIMETNGQSIILENNRQQRIEYKDITDNKYRTRKRLEEKTRNIDEFLEDLEEETDLIERRLQF